MTEAIIIRKVQEQDYTALMHIENSIWTNENSPVLHHYDNVEQYKERMGDKLIFVAVLSEKVIGFVDVHPPTPLPSHQHQWMIGIGVHPDFQSVGAGKHLLTHLKEIAPVYNIHKISLRVMGPNKRAIAFYKRNGFIQEGHLVDEFYINGDYCDDYLFAFILP
ncbi:GNAT family N-acetyltransferase [Enterococcus sp. BWT-B8]|uniref:GNAT family N-acetyltransferase n=1 Tax=unclassified Enterococcus TaxID=2608891 RepID=UPI001E33478E|nr:MULTISPECIES: GNAT family N-acetyltransferase [unclassified Enterococcus]MCB5951643.1 GNAT family N-acetyltransferase [Enterococcus sp. BWT-B8]MCB5954735.1 GNAT family N-acetyltransferase [Enterococcus sp. CWB-B31]